MLSGAGVLIKGLERQPASLTARAIAPVRFPRSAIPKIISITARRSGSPASRRNRKAPAASVLVVVLARDHGVDQIAERVWVLDRSDPDVARQRPQRDLDRMPGRASVAPRETIAVLRLQPHHALLLSELLNVAHRVNQARTPAAVKRREGLVCVFAHDCSSAVGLDRSWSGIDPRRSWVLFAA
jgi:hypothetical protein